jgi:NAD(P)-dependent dehydrogenase (short-subunit alcohol dehydrogenase family)
MKILIIGAGGTIGRAVAAELEPRHELVLAGRSSGDVHLDLADEASIRAMYRKVGTLDAVAIAAGNVHFGPLAEMGPAEFALGLNDKLMGQVNVARLAAEYLADGGSITLIGGILAEQPIRNGASASLVNAGLEGFVRGAAIELPRGIRINLVSPTVLRESLDSYGPFFRGFEPVPAARVASAYSRSIEGAQTGQVFRVF